LEKNHQFCAMLALNFPSYSFRVKNSQNRQYIFDPIRKKFVLLHPEEWVRQHLLRYLIQDRGYPIASINVEKQLMVNQMKKRYDLVSYLQDGSIFLLAECKAPQVSIDQATFDQIARYNLQLKARYLLVTNGMDHHCCELDHYNEKYSFLSEIPDFSR